MARPPANGPTDKHVAPEVSPEAAEGAVEDETDTGVARKASDDGPDGPLRRCIVRNASFPPDRLIRFVLAPDGMVTPDLAQRLPGRGAWVTAERDCLVTAARKGAFARAFRRQVDAPADLADRVEGLLARRVLDLLGLARGSGDVSAGFEQVRAALKTGRPACVFEASDGAEDGRDKVLALLQAAYGAPAAHARGADAADGTAPTNDAAPLVAGCFSSEELGMALGRERVVHIYVKQSRLAQGLTRELRRLAGFRSLQPGEWPSGTGR